MKRVVHRGWQRWATVIPLAAVLVGLALLALSAPDLRVGGVEPETITLGTVAIGPTTNVPTALSQRLERTVVAGLEGAAAQSERSYCSGRDGPDAQLVGMPETAVVSSVYSSGDGLPLASARVTVLPFVPAVAPRHTTTDRDGSFSLSGLSPGPYELRVEHDDWPTLRRAFQVGVDRDTLPPSLQVESGRLRGRCTTRGLAVAGAQVEVVDGRGPARSLAVRTSADGRFVLDRLAPGKHLVRVRSEVRAPWALREVEVTAGLELELELDLPGFDPVALRGLVSGLPAGVERARVVLTPVAAAWVPHWEPVAVEVLHGAFSAVVPSLGDYAYRLVWEGGEHEGAVGVSAQRTRVVLEIPRGCLQVWLVGEDAVPVPQPVRLLRIPADGVATVVRESGDATTADATGRLVFEHLPAGDYAVVCASGAREVRSEVVTLFPGAAQTELVFVVPR